MKQQCILTTRRKTRHLSAHNPKNGGRDLHLFKLQPQKYRGMYPLEKISYLKHRTSKPQNSHNLHTILCKLKSHVQNRQLPNNYLLFITSY